MTDDSIGGHPPPAGGDGAPREVTYDVRITPRLVLAIVGPYVAEKFMEQVKALAPVSLFLFAFQIVMLRSGILQAAAITLGLLAVVLGLMFFIEGLRLGVMPLGENIGATMPAKATLTVILSAAFLLGTIATFAEPAVATLTILGGSIPYEKAPLLYDFLSQRTTLVLLLAAAGVGVGAMQGIHRFVKGRSLKVTIMPGLVVCMALTLVAALDQNARDIIGVAWDTGGITTGTVTAPLVLALGVGMARVLGKGETGMSGFGIITLCSIWPIALVLGAAIVISWTGRFMTPAEYAALAPAAAGEAAAAGTNLFTLFGESLLGACTSMLPLIGVLLVIQRFVLKEPVRNLDHILMGVVFALLGLLLFKVGLVTGLSPLGEQVGGKATLAFTPEGGLYGSAWGRLIVLLFAFAVGYGASLAEPALLTLGVTVEEVTAGAFKRFLVMHTVAFGVGLGLILGIARIMFGWSSLAIVVPSYGLALLLTLVSDEKFVNIGWDSGGVTTGDITTPVLIALGLGVAAATGGADGFSLIAMGSVWPIIAVMALGLFINRTTPAAAPAPRA